MLLKVAGGLLALLATIAYQYPVVLCVLVFVGYSLILVLLTWAATVFFQSLWSAPKCAPPTFYAPNALYNATQSPIFDRLKPIQIASHLPIIFGRTVDGLLLQIIEYSFRDYVSPWLGAVVSDPKYHSDVLREDIWMGIQKLKERAAKVDAAKVIAVDMTVRVTVHLEKIRIARARAPDTNARPAIATNFYLATERTELEFLRKLCEIMAIYLLPSGYSLNPLRLLLSEILSLKIILPLIRLITSPDYLNQKIVHFIETRLAAAALSKRSYEYAASFEEFLRVIAAARSTDELLQLRTSVVNDIIQATTQQNLQLAKRGGLPSDGGGDASGGGGGGSSSSMSSKEAGAAAKLRRYIQQLTYAKAQCEKNLARLGWTGSFTNDLNMSLLDILSTVVGRRQFLLFLEPLQASGLIGFYTAVEELKYANKASYHQLGSEIFYTYIRAPASHVIVDKLVRMKMESFLLGDQGPDVFYDVQKAVLQTIEDKYYTSFLLSAEYQELRKVLASEDAKDVALAGEILVERVSAAEEALPVIATRGGEASPYASQVDLNNHSTYARNKLEQLQERLDIKDRALDALRSSQRPGSKLLTILGKEVEWLRMEKRQLEAHLTRTEIWSEHLGKWQASVQSVEVPDEKEPPQFMILVQVDEQNRSKHLPNGHIDPKDDHISTGWVVLRTLTEFHELHKKLRPLCADLKSLELPTTAFKLFFLKNDKGSLEKVQGQIQKYLNFILEDDDLYQSEAIYTFLSPSSENLKQGSSVSPKRNKFSLLTLFKANNSSTSDLGSSQQRNDPFWGPCGLREGEEDISSFLEGGMPDVEPNPNNKSIDGEGGKDSIAEPLYSLMGEVFDMAGVFKWLRRSVISFVQITYGRTINRQIRESIKCISDEPMLHFYASSALKSFWPGGVLANGSQPRSEDMQQMTANAAQSLLLDNIPEVMCSLVGAQTARHGALKVFQAIQSETYNRQLFYDILEIFMIELFPEIRLLEPQLNRKKQMSPTAKQ